MKSVEEKQNSIQQEQGLWMFRKMVQIRKFEDAVREIFARGDIPGFVHLYAGEEAVAVGVCAHLTDQDFITSTHRGHGHCIAKECDLKGMMAEIYGRATGLCKGKGGSMHIADFEKGMLGANGIVGGGIPLACGSALTAKVKETDQVTACFFGDGANNEGTFHEGLNLAAIWNLPVVFVAENNGYGEATPFHYASSCTHIADRAQAYNIPGVVVDGRDAVAVYHAAKEAVERAKRGEGPTLIECKTFRNYGHFEGDTQTYKTKEERESQAEKDVIQRFIQYLTDEGIASKKDLDRIENEVEREVEEAIRFAEESPFPSENELTTDVYVSYPTDGGGA
ncbi:thiamine pyrophosphate-dependent dehydrogenase E1 component subunit alpha [Melghirimyces algeriensis]|uniref:Pyruvate dehydrogenase E1 component alpha subunit n=1 Tax=Melghirimyces algeriensis TaxID=910412 RepID=A0A521BDM3_9BACL|nr:thiamine pyrophosphate-dependent dehydrogenase E1 component subunit alpha [Melghirimyces algeriensis]SMO45205.1 pyruvate dehydrogenase E1 component alpha subunit [Melghirimyces algeriensis]